MFTDESRFYLVHHDGSRRIWRCRNESLADCCVAQRDRFGGGIVIWGGISGGNRTRLVIVNGNLNGTDTKMQYYMDKVSVMTSHNQHPSSIVRFFADDCLRSRRTHSPARTLVSLGYPFFNSKCSLYNPCEASPRICDKSIHQKTTIRNIE